MVGPLLLASCGWQGPSLAGYSGLGYKVESFYERYAYERNATCLAPEMSIGGAKVVEETPERVVVNVSYHWQDNRFGNDDSDLGLGTSFGGGVGGCAGWGERTFTLAKLPGGDVQVVEMSGPQRER